MGPRPASVTPTHFLRWACLLSAVGPRITRVRTMGPPRLFRSAVFPVVAPVLVALPSALPRLVGSVRFRDISATEVSVGVVRLMREEESGHGW